MTLRALYTEQARLEALLRDVNKGIKATKRRQMVTCEKCEKRTVVNSLVYRQTSYYVRPSGCSGGDYWEEGEGQFDCPKCHHRNRLIRHGRDDKGGRLVHPTVALKPFFKEVVEVDDRG